MADWFETRFRERVDSGQLDAAFAARMRALVVSEWRADVGSTPADDTDADQHIDPDRLVDGDHQEGELIMLETEDRPTGNPAPSGRQRWPGRWLLVAAAVAVVAVGGALLAANDEGENKTTTVAVSPPRGEAKPIPGLANSTSRRATFVALEPGTYFIDPDGDASTPLRVTFEIAAEGWKSWPGATKFSEGGHAIVTIATVTNLVRDGCLDHGAAEPAVGPTVDDLTTALTKLAPFEVTSPPSDVTIQGYHGKHLALTVPDMPVSGENFTECSRGQIHSWFAPTHDGSFYGYNAEPGRIEEFWILDVAGTRLMIATNHSPKTPSQDLAEMKAIFDSIRIEP